ncbi:MAG: pyridoxal phosphate-dependent aminotransferase [Bacteroidota bacterium]
MSLENKQPQKLKVSHMAEHLIGSEIIKLANEVNELIKKGEPIANLTIGDFDPAIFPIPTVLRDEIIKAYMEGHTNYPVANGMPDLRKEVASFIQRFQGLNYSPDEVLIAGGARPVIYGIYSTIIDPGDKVVYPVPSWNNNHYCHLMQANGVAVEVFPENNFMPTAADLRPHLKGARLLALCSPQNPTGTVMSEEQLKAICELVIVENNSRSSDEKPLYIMYDQIYSALTFGANKHVDPVSLYPELRPYTIFVDGLSKSIAATGIRVGWAFGPAEIIDKMKSILSHIGAWSPKAEQIASARFMSNHSAFDNYITSFKADVFQRLEAFYEGFKTLQSFGVNCIEPMAAIYLTVQFDIKGKTTASGKLLATTEDVTAFILNEAKMAVVPFSAFGASKESTWYRLSVGTCKTENIPVMMSALRNALSSLK